MSLSEITDYSNLIDDQTRAFIDLTNSWYPPETIGFAIERQRQIYIDMCREFYQGYPPGISATDDTITHTTHRVPVRRYTCNNKNDRAMIVYFHGGGFVVGNLDSHDDVCAEICAQTQLDVTSVDYRLAPENLHPAAFEDSLACVIQERNRTRLPIILCGDSAGGNLAAAVSHTIRDNHASHKQSKIAGQVLIYPALGADTNLGSYITHANAPMLTTREVHFYNTIRTRGTPPDNDPSLKPLHDTNFSNLPDTIVFSAECDPVSDDGKHYCELLTSAGGNAQWINETGLVHGYLRARHSVDRARASFKRIINALNSMAG